MGRSRDLADGTLSELNVDSNTLAVDATNNRVGIGTASPSSTLHVSGGAGSTIRNTASSGSSWIVGTNVDSYILHNESNTPMVFTTNGTERMRIDSSGRVTMPYQPCFMAVSTDTGTVLNGGTKLNFNTAAQANNIGYSTANQRFTAPVAGKYFFTANLYVYDGYANSYAFRVNNNELNWSGDTTLITVSRRTYEGMTSGSICLQLSANDYVEVFARTGYQGRWYGRHSSWNGFLIG